MRVDYQQMYLDDVFALAKSIALKSEYCALSTNEYLSQIYDIFIDEDPRTYKSYLHLSGQYHFSDTKMQVISLDTQQVIDFDKQTLEDHPATKRGYRIDSRYYKELVEKHPNQESLIKGILYPADIEKIVQANDFEIISWDQSLVEDNEENLIPELSKWCQDYAKRWFNHSYTVTHSLYTASFLMNLYQLLPLMILDIRNRNCRSDKAHSFHVRMYLASHNGLDEFLPHLTKEQSFWLYKNIKTIQRQQGSDKTLQWVVENIITQRSIPLFTYTLEHDNQALSKGQSVADLHFKQRSYNHLTLASKESFSKDFILSKLNSSAPGNNQYHLTHQDQLDKAKWDKYNALDTKIIEAASSQVGQSTAVSLMEAALSLWAYVVATERLRVVTRYTHPITATEVTITATDAYYVFAYAYAKVHEVELEFVPALYASAAPLWPKPSLESIENITDKNVENKRLIKKLYDLSPAEKNFINLDQFQKAIKEFTYLKQAQKLIIDYHESNKSQESFKSTFHALYQDQLFIKSETGQPYKTYFENRSIDLSSFNKENFKDLYEGLFFSITGIDFNSAVGENAMQKAMIEITRRLSSYSVLFIDPTSSSMVKELQWDYIRIDPSGQESGDLYEVMSAPLEMDQSVEKSKVVQEIPLRETVIDYTISSQEGPFEIPTPIDVEEVKQEDTYTLSTNLLSLEIDDVPGLQDYREPGSYRGVVNIYNYECYPAIKSNTTKDPNELLLYHHLPLEHHSAMKPVKLQDFKIFSLPTALRYFKDDVTIVVLNAFYSNHKETTINSFSYQAGFSLLKTFEYTGHAPLRLKSFMPNIGTNLVRSLGPWTDIKTSIDIGSFRQISDKPIVVAQSINQLDFINTYIDAGTQLVDLNIKSNTNIMEFSLRKVEIPTVSLEPLKNHISACVFAFRYIPKEIEIQGLTKFIDGDINILFKPNTKRYIIGQFSMNYVNADIGIFRHPTDVELSIDSKINQHEYDGNITS